MSAVQPGVTAVAVPNLELKHILVTTDFSECSRSALQQAAAIARLHGSDVVVLHVVPPEPIINSALEPATWEYETQLQRARKQMSTTENPIDGDIKHAYLIETGSWRTVLDRVIKDREISLLVLGTHGRTGLKKLFLGSVAEQIYRIANCPVMTIGPDIEPKLLTHGRFESV